MERLDSCARTGNPARNARMAALALARGMRREGVKQATPKPGASQVQATCKPGDWEVLSYSLGISFVFSSYSLRVLPFSLWQGLGRCQGQDASATSLPKAIAGNKPAAFRPCNSPRSRVKRAR